MRLDLAGRSESFTVGRVSLATGRVTRDAEPVRGGGVVDLGRADGPTVVWLARR